MCRQQQLCRKSIGNNDTKRVNTTWGGNSYSDLRDKTKVKGYKGIILCWLLSHSYIVLVQRWCETHDMTNFYVQKEIPVIIIV